MADHVEIKEPRIQQIGSTLREVTQELDKLFPERETFIRQIVLALATGQHVLAFGPTGSAKSVIAQTVFSMIEEAQVGKINLTKFTNDVSLIGFPDLKRWRDTGEMFYRREGTVLDADLLLLEELFDANGPVLRILLPLLNERSFSYGMQDEQAKLHSAIATTNWDPSAIAQTDEGLKALVDRIIFQCNVRYLTSRESRILMYQSYVRAHHSNATISLEDLRYISQMSLLILPTVGQDILRLYDEVVDEYLKLFPKPIVSDRRRSLLLRLLSANSLLNGRTEIQPQDIEAAGLGLCLGEEDRMDCFSRLLKPKEIAPKGTMLVPSSSRQAIGCTDSSASSGPPVQSIEIPASARPTRAPLSPSTGKTSSERQDLLERRAGLERLLEKVPHNSQSAATFHMLIDGLNDELEDATKPANRPRESKSDDKTAKQSADEEGDKAHKPLPDFARNSRFWLPGLLPDIFHALDLYAHPMRPGREMEDKISSSLATIERHIASANVESAMREIDLRSKIELSNVSYPTNIMEPAMLLSLDQIGRLLPHGLMLEDDLFFHQLHSGSLQTLQAYESRKKQKLLYVLLDTSPSMYIDQLGDQSRASWAREVVTKLLHRVIEDEARCYLRPFWLEVSTLVRATTPVEARALIALIAAGKIDRGIGTNIGHALRAAIRDIRATEEELSGADIVLITDADELQTGCPPVSFEEAKDIEKQMKGDTHLHIIFIGGLSEPLRSIATSHVLIS